ncbi:MAG TPA: SAM-dependent methyltransferase [Microscillaceae bacterium]|nr:SAM-dependent methyltransferase [Microscillaceae bacterium]
MAKGTIYLIPTVLAPDTQNQVLPDYTIQQIKSIEYFFVENVRTARRFISSLKLGINIEGLTFYLIDKHTPAEEIKKNAQVLAKGKDVGVISEAGCPGIADPGALVVNVGHKLGVKVVPLVGPSSIFLALMSSGLNGQSFAFKGYLPIDKQDRIKAVKQLEKLSLNLQQTQIFMETPFRNNQMLEVIKQQCRKNTKLCVASNLTADDAYIATKTIQEWKNTTVDLHKKPTIFVLQAY